LKPIIFIIASVAVIGLFSIVWTRPSLPTVTPSLKDRFQSALDSLRQEYRLPGATAAYRLPDGTVEIVASGKADPELDIPMSPQSRMLAASIGKTFVAATAIALAQEGKLHLDDPLAKWLGGRFWFSRLPNHDQITLRHLLTHSAGIANHVELAAFQRLFREHWQDDGPPLPPDSLIALVLDRPPLFEPGEGWHYSDTGYLLIGLIIEAASGNSYYEEVERRWIKPLQLQLTAPSNRRELPGLAAGYLSPDNAFGLPAKTTLRPGLMAWHPGLEWTGGGLVSNPGDLVRWAGALYEGRAMEGEYLTILLYSVPVSADAPAVRYGLGVAIHRDGPLGTTYGHAGWIPGYCSSLRYYPETGIAVSFQINTDIGIADGETPVMEQMEAGLAKIVLEGL